MTKFSYVYRRNQYAGHLVRNWKVRWFVLKNDHLFYFKKRGDFKPLGEVPLEGANLTTDTKIKKSNCFELYSPKIDKVFYVQAANKAEMDSWLNAIQDGSEYCVVGAPFNVEHNIHVDFNSETGFVVRLLSFSLASNYCSRLGSSL